MGSHCGLLPRPIPGDDGVDDVGCGVIGGIDDVGGDEGSCDAVCDGGGVAYTIVQNLGGEGKVGGGDVDGDIGGGGGFVGGGDEGGGDDSGGGGDDRG